MQAASFYISRGVQLISTFGSERSFCVTVPFTMSKIEINKPLAHFRIGPALGLRPVVGFHHTNIVRAITQHATEAAMSGISWSNSRANAASIVAASIQSWATLIITKRTSRACQTAVRPGSGGRLPA